MNEAAVWGHAFVSRFEIDIQIPLRWSPLGSGGEPGKIMRARSGSRGSGRSDGGWAWCRPIRVSGALGCRSDCGVGVVVPERSFEWVPVDLSQHRG